MTVTTNGSLLQYYRPTVLVKMADFPALDLASGKYRLIRDPSDLGVNYDDLLARLASDPPADCFSHILEAVGLAPCCTVRIVGDEPQGSLPSVDPDLVIQVGGTAPRTGNPYFRQVATPDMIRDALQALLEQYCEEQAKKLGSEYSFSLPSSDPPPHLPDSQQAISKYAERFWQSGRDILKVIQTAASTQSFPMSRRPSYKDSEVRQLLTNGFFLLHRQKFDAVERIIEKLRNARGLDHAVLAELQILASALCGRIAWPKKVAFPSDERVSLRIIALLHLLRRTDLYDWCSIAKQPHKVQLFALASVAPTATTCLYPKHRQAICRLLGSLDWVRANPAVARILDRPCPLPDPGWRRDTRVAAGAELSLPIVRDQLVDLRLPLPDGTRLSPLFAHDSVRCTSSAHDNGAMHFGLETHLNETVRVDLGFLLPDESEQTVSVIFHLTSPTLSSHSVTVYQRNDSLVVHLLNLAARQIVLGLDDDSQLATDLDGHCKENLVHFERRDISSLQVYLSDGSSLYWSGKYLSLVKYN